MLNTTERIEITGKSTAKVLAALYNNTRPVGLGLVHASPAKMTEAEAEAFLAQAKRGNCAGFDYLKGRPLKISFFEVGGKTFIEGGWLYDRDAGEGKLERVLAELA